MPFENWETPVPSDGNRSLEFNGFDLKEGSVVVSVSEESADGTSPSIWRISFGGVVAFSWLTEECFPESLDIPPSGSGLYKSEQSPWLIDL